jgi:hypothetical protein
VALPALRRCGAGKVSIAGGSGGAVAGGITTATNGSGGSAIVTAWCICERCDDRQQIAAPYKNIPFHHLTKWQVSDTIENMRAKQPAKLTDQVRQVVEDCGKTRYAIAKATGISEATLARLVSGERFLSPDALDALAEYLGLRIVADKPKTKGK